MNLTLNPSWKPYLHSQIQQPYFKELMLFLEREYQEYTCYPPVASIFAAFNSCSFEETKVVILGQDPYHGPHQANGLCFSVQDGVSYPPSLKNIFKELGSDLGLSYPSTGNLESWAKQGVLLLNATLTVRAQEAGSHQKQGWEQFTDAVISEISKHKKDVIFVLWGGQAKKKQKLIDTKKHHVLLAGHPSPLSANRGYWFGNKHFSKINAILEKTHNKIIDWRVI